MTMKILLWNINGIRAILKKKVKDNIGFEEFVSKYDIICLNETKITDVAMEKINILENHKYVYHKFCSTKKSYSGVSIYSKIKPIKELKSFDDNEGRIIVLEYDKFVLVNTYQPNSGSKLLRLEHRTHTWDIKFRYLIKRLQRYKNVVICGDMNVAHNEIDIHNPDSNHLSAGFTDIERLNFDKLLFSQDLIDVWRYIYPNTVRYTYFDYKTLARSRGNRGWRIDYFLVSNKLKNKIKSIKIHSNIYGSDHIPINIILDL